MTASFTARSLSKSFVGQKVLLDVSFELRPGDFSLLLGANGAGKSTLLRICSGLAHADGGSLLIDGQERKEPLELFFAQCAFLSHSSQLYSHLTLEENMQLSATLRGLRLDLKSYLEEWQLTEFKKRRVVELSRGQQQRGAIARALLHKPRFVFFDEISSALDEDALLIVLGHLKKLLSDGKSCVILATHDINRLASYANRILLLEKGTLLMDSLALEYVRVDRSLTSIRSEVIDYYLRVNR